MNDIELLISMDINSILKSGEYTMLLLRTYSALFLNGSQPSTCTSCMRDYHTKIIKEGKMKAQLLEKVKARTCVPNWEGVKFVKAIVKNGKMITIHQHINPDVLTDEKAIELLKSGALTDADFSKLPDSFKKPGKKKEVKEEVKKDK